jgi:hypothetical protein
MKSIAGLPIGSAHAGCTLMASLVFVPALLAAMTRVQGRPSHFSQEMRSAREAAPVRTPNVTVS